MKSKLLEINNVGIVVENLDKAIAFFTEIGLTLEGRMIVEDEWAGRVEALQKEMENVFSELFALRNDSQESDIVQQHIARHYGIISKFWGKSVVPDQKACAYAGLGDMYVNDERYLANVTDGNPQPEFALFLQKAMKYFAENNLEK